MVVALPALGLNAATGGFVCIFWAFLAPVAKPHGLADALKLMAGIFISGSGLLCAGALAIGIAGLSMPEMR